MKYDVIQTRTFRKSLKRMIKRGKEKGKLLKVVNMLARGITLPPEYKDHALSGNLSGLRDCHIENDWALIYLVQDNILTLTLSDTAPTPTCSKHPGHILVLHIHRIGLKSQE